MLDRTLDTPLYLQLAALLREDIAAGRLRPGDKLPSESELVERYGVGRVTVREALALLVNEGLLRKLQGRGTFVRAAHAGQPLRIDVLLDLRERTFAPDYLESIEGVLRRYGATCVLHNTQGSDDTAASCIDEAAQAGASGVILRAGLPLPAACRRAAGPGGPPRAADAARPRAGRRGRLLRRVRRQGRRVPGCAALCRVRPPVPGHDRGRRPARRLPARAGV